LGLYKEQLNRQAKEYWYAMDGWTFEKELTKLYNILGYSAQVTKGSGDGGVDIVLKKNDDIAYVQCKAYKSQIGPAPIRELYGVMKADNIHYGIVASFMGFTPGAIEFAERNNIKLIDLDDIIQMAGHRSNEESTIQEPTIEETVSIQKITNSSRFWNKGIYK
jgi:restriction system protein